MEKKIYGKDRVVVSVKIQLPEVIKLKLLEFAQKNCRTLNKEILYIILESIKNNEKSDHDLSDFIKQFIAVKNKRKDKKQTKSKLILFKNENKILT